VPVTIHDRRGGRTAAGFSGNKSPAHGLGIFSKELAGKLVIDPVDSYGIEDPGLPNVRLSPRST